MVRISTLTLFTLLAFGQAAERTEELRQDERECAVSTDDTAMFTDGKITESLPSEPVKLAETDVTGANLIAIAYGSNFKVLTEKMSKEVYVLTQCGTTKPTNAQLAEVKADHASYTVKHFTIPLQVASSSSTVHLGFFKALGVEDRIKYVSKYATGPCWQKAVGCGSVINTSHAPQMEEVNAMFMDCSWDGTCDNVNKEAKGVHFSASQEPGPLRSAEHLKFIAAFFNKEELATSLFASTLVAYTSASVEADPKPLVAWISSEPKSDWGDAKLVLSQASYKLKMVSDAGGANVDGAAVKAAVGSKMGLATAATGKTYSVLLKDFNGSMTEASAAFFAALSEVDIVIDETYAYAPKSYTMDSFLAGMGLTKDSTLKFVAAGVLRIDGTISATDGLDWYESRIAHPDWAVEGLARQLHGDVSKRFKYFRNIATGEVPVVLTPSMCTTTLPACDAKAYPVPIVMMKGGMSSSKASQMCLGSMLLFLVAALQA